MCVCEGERERMLAAALGLHTVSTCSVDSQVPEVVCMRACLHGCVCVCVCQVWVGAVGGLGGELRGQ